MDAILDAIQQTITTVAGLRVSDSGNRTVNYHIAAVNTQEYWEAILLDEVLKRLVHPTKVHTTTIEGGGNVMFNVHTNIGNENGVGTLWNEYDCDPYCFIAPNYGGLYPRGSA
jgi:hypothetical protein